MSNAHRPTWAPAMGRESKGNSRQYSNKDLASHTKLKFRQPGQTSTSDVAQSDLRRQLLIAERAAIDKKRRDRGLGALPELILPGALRIESGDVGEDEGEESRKRRKALEDVVGLDRDDDDDEPAAKKAKGDDDDDDDDDDDEDEMAGAKGKGKAKDDGSDSDSSSDSDSDDDEDDTAELLRELAKIKRERAEEKERQDLLASQSAAVDREAEIATGNPLMNLAAALGTAPGPASPTGSMSTVSGGFKVGRRWDDDLIFKNQASGTEDKNKKKEFVNDLLRSDFHRQFMAKFLK